MEKTGVSTGATIRDRYREFDVAVQDLVHARRQEGHFSPCHRGCDACCYEAVVVTPFELLPMIEAIRRLPNKRKRAIKARLRSWLQRVTAAGLNPWKSDPNLRTYLRARLACPLLDHQTHECTLYAERPIACRAHYVVDTTPAACAKRAEVWNVPAINAGGVVRPFYAALVDENSPGADKMLYMRFGLLPGMLIFAWSLVENPERSISAWLEGVARDGRTISADDLARLEK